MADSYSPRELEQLSAYLDGQLSARERARLESRLWQDPALRNALDELDRTRQALRSLPRLRAPRNFTLTPQMVGQRRVAPRLYPAFGFVSALAMLLLLGILIFDLLGNTPASGGQIVALQASTETAAAVAAQQDQSADTAPLALEALPVSPEVETQTVEAAANPEAARVMEEPPPEAQTFAENQDTGTVPATPTNEPAPAEKSLVEEPATATMTPAADSGIGSAEVVVTSTPTWSEPPSATPYPTETCTLVPSETPPPTDEVALKQAPAPSPIVETQPGAEALATQDAPATAVAALPTLLPTMSMPETPPAISTQVLHWLEAGLALLVLVSGSATVILYLVWRRKGL